MSKIDNNNVILGLRMVKMKEERVYFFYKEIMYFYELKKKKM